MRSDFNPETILTASETPLEDARLVVQFYNDQVAMHHGPKGGEEGFWPVVIKAKDPIDTAKAIEEALRRNFDLSPHYYVSPQDIKDGHISLNPGEPAVIAVGESPELDIERISDIANSVGDLARLPSVVVVPEMAI